MTDRDEASPEVTELLFASGNGRPDALKNGSTDVYTD